MKTFSEYVSEASNKTEHVILKATNSNIRAFVEQEIERLGTKADLNHIDVSRVTDMTSLFTELHHHHEYDIYDFNGDISKWDVSNVTNMTSMFFNCDFNGDISKWNVSKVKKFDGMFFGSKFNRNIDNWKINNKASMNIMFDKSALEKSNKLPNWYKG